MADVHPLLRYTRSQEAWILDTLEALVRAESPSTRKAAADRCANELAGRLAGVGAQVERVAVEGSGDHLRARCQGAGRQVMVLGHFDTVWDVGQIERMPYRRTNGRVHGPGVYDMKAGLAVAMLALRALEALALERPPIVLVLTADEETGSRTSRALVEEEARASRAVLVLEPPLPGGGVKTSRKGVGEFVLTVRGVAAHAGIAPALGANAVHELAHQIVDVQTLQDPGRGVSVNVTVASGGGRSNVIPDEATGVIDVRVPTLADAARIERALRSLVPVLQGTAVDVAGGLSRPPLERGPGVVALFEIARACARALGQDLDEGQSGGGSDGNFTGAIGVPTLDGLGPQGDGAHALHEHVIVADLTWRAALLAAILARLGGPGPGEVE